MNRDELGGLDGLTHEEMVWELKSQLNELEIDIDSLKRDHDALLRLAVADAVLAERRACAEIAEKWLEEFSLPELSPEYIVGMIADAIRARGKGE